MAEWIEVKVRYEKVTDKGLTIKVTEPYLVDALSCTEAEARVIEEVLSYVSGEYDVLSANKTKISDVFWNADADKFYKVKVNYITLNEKTGAEKRTAQYIIVQASNFAEAFKNFNKGMAGSMADYEIESIAETKIVDVLKYKIPGEAHNTAKVVEKVVTDKGVKQAVKNFNDAVPDGMAVSVGVQSSDGAEIIPKTVIVDKSKPRSDDD